jgi:hypothetical protein
MNPQAPIITPESSEVFPIPSTPLDVQSTIQPGPKPKDNHWISILAMAIFVVLTLGVVAFLYYQNQALKSMLASLQTPIGSPQPTAQAATPTPDPTANWKTYTDTKLGFNFRYPQNSIIKLDTLNANGSLEFSNFILNIEKTNANLADYVVKLKDVTSSPTPITKDIGNLSTIEWIGFYKNAPAHYISFENNGYVYNFGVTPLDDMTVYNSNDTSLLSKILSTFKFIESLPSASPISSATPIPTSIPSTIPGGF